jgi:hypothetical protein
MKKTQSAIIDRREFALQAALLALSGVTITVSACGGSDSPSTPTTPTTTTTTPPAPSGDEVGSVSANHGHTAVITAAQLAAAGAINLDISGTSGHMHTVQISAAEVGQIAGGTRVTKTSSTNDGHNHDVTFN